MKSKIFFLTFVLLFSCEFILAQTPTYTLKVDSMRIVDVAPFTNNALEFGIYLTQTNAPVEFGYGGQQLFISINPGILPDCLLNDTGNCLRYRIIGSELPLALQPRNPSISTATMPAQTVLRLAVNAFPGVALNITGATNLLICKMRLTSTYGCFNQGGPGLAWRNPPAPSFATRIWAYNNDLLTDITTPSTHTVDSSGMHFYQFTGCFYNFLDLTILNEGFYSPALDRLSRRDTFRVYLRNILPPYDIVDSTSTFIDTINFSNEFIFRNAPSGMYYIVAKHFNSIETWSKAGGETFNQQSTTIYNFTTEISQAFGNNLKLKGTRYCIISGDVDQNGIIDGSDLAAIDNDAFIYRTGIRLPTDLDGNNFVEGSDLQIGDNNVGREVISP